MPTYIGIVVSIPLCQLYHCLVLSEGTFAPITITILIVHL